MNYEAWTIGAIIKLDNRKRAAADLLHVHVYPISLKQQPEAKVEGGRQMTHEPAFLRDTP